MASYAQPATSLSVNSSAEECYPFISADESRLYFSRKGHSRNMGEATDIWVTYRKASGEWTNAINLGAPVNSLGDEQIVGLEVSNQPLYLFRLQDGALYKSIRRGRSWSAPVYQQIEGVSLQGKKVSISIGFDGRTLLLSMPGEQGQDIYASFLHGENYWSQPAYCGSSLNSPQNERTPFLAADNKTLYFASNRSGGAGGYDLYKSYRLDDSWINWTAPVALSSDINTTADELSPSLPARGSRLYFCRRENNTADLYSTTLPQRLQPEAVVMVKGQVQHQTDDRAVPATVNLEGASLPQAKQVETEQDGSFQFILPYGEKINLSAEVEGFFPISEPVKGNGKAPESIDQPADPIMVALGNDIAYKQRDEEIRNLQLHLRMLDEEMLEIQKIRQQYLDQLQAERGPSIDRSHLTDPELDALRHRFNRHVRAEATAAARDTLPPAYDQAEMTKQDVEDMKTRYMRFYDNQKDAQEAEEQAAENKQYMWDEPRRSFEEVEEEVVSELEKEVRPEVERRLSQELTPEVAREVQAELSPLERQYVDLEPEALKQQIDNSFERPRSRQWTAKGQTAEAKWERELKQDLRQKLEAPVRSELREELAPEVKERLKVDISYYAKREAKAKVEQELQQKLQQQMAAEAASNSRGNINDDAVQPLIPLPDLSTSGKGNYKEVEKNLLLVPAEIGMLIPLNSVSFEPNSARLQHTAYPELNRVLNFLQRNDSLIIEIGVHTGGQLSHTNAQQLSRLRAQEVSQFLIANGIDQGRILAKGYGKSLPIADNSTKQGQRRNQRVEMRIVGRE